MALPVRSTISRKRPAPERDYGIRPKKRLATEPEHEPQIRELIRSRSFYDKLTDSINEHVESEQLAQQLARCMLSSIKGRKSFLDLPAEIRNQVYGAVLDLNRWPQIGRMVDMSKSLKVDHEVLLAFTATCKLVRAELRSMFFSESLLFSGLKSRANRVRLYDWLDRLPTDAATQIRGVCVEKAGMIFAMSLSNDLMVLYPKLWSRCRSTGQQANGLLRDDICVACGAYAAASDLSTIQSMFSVLSRIVANRPEPYLTAHEIRRVLGPVLAVKLRLPTIALRTFQVAWGAQKSRY